MSTPAAELFALGFAQATALHPVGLTERARRACRASSLVAEGVPSPDGTPSLLLGQLEGIWAVIYGRREEIEALHAGAFKAILKAISKLDWGSIVDAVESQQLIDPGISGDMLAGEIRARIWSMIEGSLPPQEQAAWRSVISAALTDGAAEGQTAAAALLSHAVGAGIDWDLTAAEAKAALSGGQTLADTSDLWVREQIKGVSYQLSQRLAALWDAGASRKEMLEEIMSILGSDKGVASAILDSTIGQALSQGALATYATAGVPNADFVTAGDSRVCPVCSGAEDGSPYPLASCPQPPLHIRCRCTVAPSDVFPLSLVSSSEEA